MAESYVKNDLITELAAASHISKRRVEAVLDALTAVAYREARRGFAVPGICRLDVVHRRARQVRNPQTGESLIIAEHDALRVRPVKRAKHAIAPAPKALVQVMPAAAADPAVTAPSDPSPPPAAAGDPTAPAAARVPASTPFSFAHAPPAAPVASPAAQAAKSASSDDEGPLISFRCKNCGQEIEATLEMIGNTNECPSCGEALIVPYVSEPGTIWYRELNAAGQKAEPDDKMLKVMKSRTIRIELPDDI